MDRNIPLFHKGKEKRNETFKTVLKRTTRTNMLLQFIKEKRRFNAIFFMKILLEESHGISSLFRVKSHLNVTFATTAVPKRRT